MILSRKAIQAAIAQGAITIMPLTDEQLDKAHVDLHLGELKNGQQEMVLPPKSFTVAKTKEKIRLSDEVCAFIEGRATQAKQGISIEQSSTFIEPGSDNYMTLEIFNASDEPYILKSGQTIAKMYLMKVTDEF